MLNQSKHVFCESFLKCPWKTLHHKHAPLISQSLGIVFRNPIAIILFNFHLAHNSFELLHLFFSWSWSTLIDLNPQKKEKKIFPNNFLMSWYISECKWDWSWHMLSGLVGLKLCFMKVTNYQSQRPQKSGFFYDRVRRGITYDLVNKFYLRPKQQAWVLTHYTLRVISN